MIYRDPANAPRHRAPAEPLDEAAARGAEECAGCVRLSGTVLDASGGSIAGAELSASDASGAPLAAGASDGSGQFRLQVAPGLVRLRARADGYSEQVHAIEAPLDGLRLVLAPESSIVGRVLAAGTGEPVAGALVTAVGQEGPAAEPHAVRSGADGAFRVSGLLAGRHSLVAVAPRWRGEPRELAVGVAETVEPVELRVFAATPLRGVVHVGGEACARGSVFVRGAVQLFSVLGPDGSVAFDGVPPGRYVLDVRCSGALALEEPLELGSEPVTRTWELEAGLALRGVALSAGGRPLAGAAIEVAAVGEPAGRAGTSCTSDEAGRFSCSGLVPGEYECAIGSGVPLRSDSVRVTLSAEAEPSVELRAYAEGAIRVHLQGSREFEQRTLTLVARSAKQLLVAEPRGSEFVFEPVALGTYEVALESAEPGAGRRVELTHQGEVAELTLALPAPQSISGRVVDEAGQGIPDAWVSVTGTSSFAQLRPLTPVLTDGDGAFVVPGLLPARHRLSASSGQRSAELELDSGSQGVLVTLREQSAAAGADALAEVQPALAEP